MGIARHYRIRQVAEGGNKQDSNKIENLSGSGGVEPTHSIQPGERRAIEIAGIELELVAAPAETVDAIYIWLPEQKVLFSGNTFYKPWPNLAPFRGIQYCDIKD